MMDERHGCGRGRQGFAMVAVLLVLMALFVLCAPFLLTVRNADRASAQHADLASSRLALDAATRHARARLGASHAAADPTPYHDSLEELEVTNDFPEGFLDPSDESGVMWDLEVADLAGRVDLNSAPPQMIANLTGGVARLRAKLAEDAKEIPVHSTAGFAPQGLVWVGGELIGYSTIEGASFQQLAREIGVLRDADGAPYPCGPAPRAEQDLGQVVIDERAWAVARWRTGRGGGGEDGELRTFDAIEQVADAATELLRALQVPGSERWDAQAILERTATVFGGVRAGATWQRASRLVGAVQAGPEGGCRLQLDEARWFNPGTTVRISDGRTTEYGVVRVAGPGQVVLMDPLVNDYAPYTAEVRPLARRPVNVNTAPPEVLRALFLEVQLRGRNSRMTGAKADQLVEVVVASRPFVGFEDLLRRALLPSAGLEALPKDAPVVPPALAAQEGGLAAADDTTAGFLSESDAVALYKNALNANDGELLYSTMPLCFESRDVYELDLRASVNAASGVERVSRAREQVELVVPQRPLMQVWGRQEDFELALRLEREAAGWVTGPHPTARFDPLYESDPPPRARAHLGPHDTVPSHDPLADEPTYTFASREEDGWAQLAPARTDETDAQVAERQGHVLHFDDERRDLEGRYLPDGTIALSPTDPLVSWQQQGGLLEPVSFSMWIQPRALEDGARFLDLGGRFPDTDRVSLLLDGDDLVLRVVDGAGDHPETGFREWGEARYPLTQGPGMPLDTWIHVQGDVRGNRPDQITLLVDGRADAETPGLTKLTGGIGPDSATIPVESTDGFPDGPCVLRIGNELIEAVKSGASSFVAQFSSQGEQAGFGGRQARERFIGEDPGVSEATLNTSKDLSHPAGTAVQLYGYSLPLRENVSPVQGTLIDPVGPFAVARVTGIVANGGERLGNQMEPITVSLGPFAALTIGYGMDSQDADVEGLILEAVDPNADVAGAFQRSGGYALLVGPSITVSSSAPGSAGSTDEDSDGSRIGGMELIHYVSFDGRRLLFDRRGDAVPELQRPQAARQEILPILAGRGSWIFDWDEGSVTFNGGNPDENMVAITKLIPISIGIRGAVGGLGFPVPVPTQSEFVQLTPRAAADAGRTEWVRYDEIVGQQFVRSDPAALEAAYLAALAGQTGIPIDEQPRVPPGQGGGGPGQTSMHLPPAAPPRIGAPPPAAAPAPAQSGGPYWQPSMGEIGDANHLVTLSVRTHLQFRGVLGTFSHQHDPGETLVLPVLEVPDQGLEQGWPGRFDRVVLMDFQPETIGWPGVVQHAHRPLWYTAYGWNPGASLAVTGTPPTSAAQDPFLVGRTFVALRDAAQAPIAAGGAADPYEIRTYGRMTAFPSGERPRITDALTLGGEFRGAGAGVPSALIDEVVFGTTSFGQLDGSRATHGSQLVLELALAQGAQALDLVDHTVRGAATVSSLQAGFLAAASLDAGLVRIDEEILCYADLDPGSFAMTVPNGGRGLLGTDDENHAQGSGVTFLNTLRVSVLAGGIGENDAAIPLADAEGFPERGTVLIDGELIHYTRVRGAVLEMPSASETPGAMDARGGGVFRGRYGTQPTAHAGGTPVILMPFRYWDRWAERADVPEMHYLGLSVVQPNAFWRAAFWDQEPPAAPGPRLGVLQRTDPDLPWDADPETSEEIEVYWDGVQEGDGIAIGEQADRIDWRVFVRYERGSFDPLDGLAHGWKATPRLRFLGVEYLGPGAVLRRVER